MIVKKQEVPLDQWERYLAFRRGMSDDWSSEVLIHRGAGSSPAPVSDTASTENVMGTVKDDSLPVYSEMTKESDVVLTLTHGAQVRVGLSVASDEGMFCSIFNADTSAKLGYVRCDGLDRQSVTSTAATGSGADLSSSNFQSSGGTTASCDALQGAAAGGQTSEVKSILETKPDLVNCRGSHGFRPLHTAADHDQTQVIELLIADGAEIDARSDAGDTPLHWAAFDGRTDAATLLIERGAEVNPKDKDGNTPLHWAAARGHVKMTELLIAHGADLRARTYTGCTPLRGAYDHRQPATARLLLQHGATQ